MKKLNQLTEVPAILKPFYNTLPELVAEAQIFLDSSHRNDVLMAKMFEKLSSREAEAVREEIATIATNMNDMMLKRFKRQDRMLMGIGMMAIAELMVEYAHEAVLTAEQFAMLTKTGAFDQLLTAKTSS